MSIPSDPKIYHIVHWDKLPSIVADGYLWSDAEIERRGAPGTVIGMDSIKQRRLRELSLTSHPDLYVGECVPFYFCPRSIMLYLIFQANHPDLSYRGGQEPVVHLEADVHRVVEWAGAQKCRWAFTLSNAGSRFFEDRADLSHLHELNWQAIAATDWYECKDGKQAEFLIERRFPWQLVERIGVYNQGTYHSVTRSLRGAGHRPVVEVAPKWYY